jgi:hypothetical protein
MPFLMIYADACVIVKGRKASCLKRVVAVVVSLSKFLCANVLSKILTAVSLSTSGMEIILNGVSFMVSFWFWVVNRI